MPEGEEPIIVKPGVYPNPTVADQNLVGICLVVDDKNTWKITHAEDGSTTINVPASSKWRVVEDNLKLADNSVIRRVAILRLNGTLTTVEKKNEENEHEIDYTLI